MRVFTPYHQAWLAKVKANPDLLATVPAPEKSDVSASKDLKSLFNSQVLDPAKDKQVKSTDEHDRIREIVARWPQCWHETDALVHQEDWRLRRHT